MFTTDGAIDANRFVVLEDDGDHDLNDAPHELPAVAAAGFGHPDSMTSGRALAPSSRYTPINLPPGANTA